MTYQFRDVSLREKSLRELTEIEEEAVSGGRVSPAPSCTTKDGTTTCKCPKGTVQGTVVIKNTTIIICSN